MRANKLPHQIGINRAGLHGVDGKGYPHPCGYYGDPTRSCRCPPRQIENYRQLISAFPLDEIDLHVEVPMADLAGGLTSEPLTN